VTVEELRGLMRATREALHVRRSIAGAGGADREAARAFAFGLPHPTPAQRPHALARLRRLGGSLETAVQLWRELDEIRRAA
jgi:hypothetical protein